MIDPATNWFEMKQLKDKYFTTVANLVEQTWLCRYSTKLIRITYNKGSEFMAEFGQMIETVYGIIKKTNTKRHPQANSMIERIHRTLET